jgi:hypothetical protein
VSKIGELLMRFVAAILILVLDLVQVSPGCSRADDDWSHVVPPVAFRPANYDGAIGSFKVSMRARPVEVVAEDPIVLTVRISGSGNLSELRRPNLLKIRAFVKAFDVLDLGDRYLAEEAVREFDYRLRPRYAGTREIPPLDFGYFKPGIIPPEKGYQTTYAAPLAIRVLPRPELAAKQEQGGTGIRWPQGVRRYVSGSGVLQKQAKMPSPSSTLLVAMLLAPPLLCTFWCIVRARRLHAWRRSPLSLQARKALQKLDRCDGADCGIVFARIMSDYLQPVLGPLPNEVSPGDLSARLRERGCSADVAWEAAQLFEWRDAARFAPGAPSFLSSFKGKAALLITALEKQAWQSARL